MSARNAIPLILLLFLPSLILGLLKSQDGPLVASPQKDVVYLIQAPRSAFTISQAPLNVKVEAFLRVNKVKYLSASTMVFLGSSTDGSCPFAELNGQKLTAVDPFQGGNLTEGSNAIVEQVAAHFNLTWPRNNGGDESAGDEEAELRRTIDYDLFNTVVMHTRASVYRVSSSNGSNSQVRMGAGFNVSSMQIGANGTLVDAQGNPMRTGLDFMLADESIREQMFSLLIDLAGNAQRTLLGVVLSRSLVNSYFDARANGSEAAQAEFLAQGGWTNVSWATVNAGMQRMDTVFLINRLILAPGGALDNAEKYLQLNTLDGQSISSYSDQEIVAKVQGIYGQIAEQLAQTDCEGKSRLYLFGSQRTPADCSLFGSLVAFFGIPLTVPEMVTYMEAVRDQSAHPHHILFEFYEQMKVELGMADVWQKLSSRPFPLNWESQEQVAFEQQMQEVVWAAAKRAFVVGATSRLAIGNEH